MAAFATRYPIVFQAEINHAQRLRIFLDDRERKMPLDAPAWSWLIGRAGEVQCFVAIVALDWHQCRVSADEAAARLARYLKDLHDGLAMHLDIGMPPCCRVPVARARATDPMPSTGGGLRPP